MVDRKRRKTPEPPPGSTESSRVLILFEQMQLQLNALGEGMRGTERRILDAITDRFSKIEARLDALEFAMRQAIEDIRKNSEDIRKNSEDIRKNSEDIKELRFEVKRLGSILGADRDENAIATLERRVTALEQRVGLRS